MLIDVHALVQHADHDDEFPGDAVVDGVRPYGMSAVPGPNLIAPVTNQGVVRDTLDGALKCADLSLGLVGVPPVAGVVPDLF